MFQILIQNVIVETRSERWYWGIKSKINLISVDRALFHQQPDLQLQPSVSSEQYSRAVKIIWNKNIYCIVYDSYDCPVAMCATFPWHTPHNLIIIVTISPVKQWGTLWNIFGHWPRSAPWPMVLTGVMMLSSRAASSVRREIPAVLVASLAILWTRWSGRVETVSVIISAKHSETVAWILNSSLQTLRDECTGATSADSWSSMTIFWSGASVRGRGQDQTGWDRGVRRRTLTWVTRCGACQWPTLSQVSRTGTTCVQCAMETPEILTNSSSGLPD